MVGFSANESCFASGNAQVRRMPALLAQLDGGVEVDPAEYREHNGRSLSPW